MRYLRQSHKTLDKATAAAAGTAPSKRGNCITCDATRGGLILGRCKKGVEQDSPTFFTVRYRGFFLQKNQAHKSTFVAAVSPQEDLVNLSLCGGGFRMPRWGAGREKLGRRRGEGGKWKWIIIINNNFFFAAVISPRISLPPSTFPPPSTFEL